MNYMPLLGFYFRNKEQISEIEAKIAATPGVEGGHPLLLAWISANIAIAQRMWPAYANLLGDLNSTLAEMISKG